MKYPVLLLLASLLTVSCSSTGGGPLPGKTPPSLPDGVKTVYLTGTPQWRTMADVKKALGSKAKVTGTKADLMGNRISGKNLKHPKDRNDESAVALRVYIDKFHLTNGRVEDIPGRIMIRAKGTRWSKLIFTKNGEDFISTIKDAAPGTTIEECKFYNDGGDKSVQLNDADDSLIKGTLITGGQTGARIQESSSKNKSVKARIEGTTFDGVPTAINADGHTTLELKGNTYKNVSQRLVKGSKVKVKNL